MTADGSRQRPGLNSDIPDTYPTKDVLEAFCRQLLHELGAGWLITIASQPNSRAKRTGKWAMGLSLSLPDGRYLHRTWHAHPHPPEAVERRFRSAVEEIQRDASSRLGMIPLRAIDNQVAEDLHAWVRAHGGDVEDDGWVWLPDRANWEPFVELAREAGIEYAVDVR